MPTYLKPTSVIKASLGINPNGKVSQFFTNQCAKRMNKYIPEGYTSNLRTVVDIQTNTITYEMPYAHYQYVGMREDGTHAVKKYTTPGTGPYWDKRMWTAEGQNIIQEVQKYIEGKH